MKRKEAADGLNKNTGCHRVAYNVCSRKFAWHFMVQIFFFLLAHYTQASHPKDGFFLPDNVPEVTFKFRKFRNLIVLPVTINDTIHVNLVLDTGCRNLLLFGQGFEKLFKIEPRRKVEVSGLGEGQALYGKLSVNNKVSIHPVLGEKIPVVIVAHQQLFENYSNVDGIIGYDIFIKFEVEINSGRRLITFRPAESAEVSSDYTKIPLRIMDCKPIMQSKIFFSIHGAHSSTLMLDTGSALGLLLKSSDRQKFFIRKPEELLAIGLNGNVMGSKTVAEKIILETFEINKKMTAGIIWSSWHNYGSVGMEIIKNYSVVLNYCKGYALFKKSKHTLVFD